MTIDQIRDAWAVLRGHSRAVPVGPEIHLAVTVNGELFGSAMSTSGLSREDLRRQVDALAASARRRIEMEVGDA